MSDKEYADECVQFDWRYVRKKGRYGLESLDTGQRRILERKLGDYARYTLDSFRRAKGVHLHEFDLKTCRKAPSEHQQMQVEQEIFTEPCEQVPLLRFRVSSKMRVLGYMDRTTFFLIWVDANHEMGG